ncbi:hypothetical protein [Flavobacterium subsaxonicum]|uniref:Tetratricopeptide repeat protein n=1 Tax=Flavobacterium subsaxonicum WB 4.1-42 = DSM 21790 TaxID=1121898 RepID=A0A0A2MIK8_9FLAO|nr:hypothetical protein [Flavobacterium subsaxonicum]KGO92472.1 hypothetical protein Q766_11860 [Flavobacterium subsaxonicum WB 4.1-42 = DSM 21790]
MKKLQLFILVLLSSSITANACGFYPYGEDIRFCFFKPRYYGYKTFSEFDYSSQSFSPKELYGVNETEPNIQLWYNYCKGKVPQAEIKKAVYTLSDKDFNKKSDNKMVKYLFAVKDTQAINYLLFAKKCELMNTYYEDPWERTDNITIPQRTNIIDQAIVLAAKADNTELKLRYTFLAIRMAYYNEQKDKLRSLFDTFFATIKNKDIVYYWSLYFTTLTETDPALANFYAAQVFAHAPEKRFMISWSYNRAIPFDKVLKFAKTNEERANVYVLAGIIRSDRALEEIKEAYRYNAGSEGLSFLLLREVNKIEDWIYTPYYSLFAPSIVTNYDTMDDSAKIVLERVEHDRQYAAKVLQFVQSVDKSVVENAQFWKLAEVQLLFSVKNYAACLNSIASLETVLNKNTTAFKQLQQLKALALTASQPQDNAVILDNVKPVILSNKKNQKFLFALGRELEYKGNTSDAALLYSKLTNDVDYTGEYDNDSAAAYWRTLKNDDTTYGDFYTNYFDYINVYYTPQQTIGLIRAIEKNTAQDAFSVWKFSSLKNEVKSLYDLLGTQYIRQNKLKEALSSFKSVGREYWDMNYSAWERGKADFYGDLFNKSPFYDIKHTPKFIPVKDSIMYNKYTVTKYLINYLDKAENVKEKDRDYYYFLVATCYYNMTEDGNSWMMRRFYWTSNYNTTIAEDEKEYREANLAKKYYTLAIKHAKTAKFKALCLRMMAHIDDEKGDNKGDYYTAILNKYPEYYKELSSESSCTAFTDYFRARR